MSELLILAQRMIFNMGRQEQDYWNGELEKVLSNTPAPQSEWISVDDELPPDGEYVIIHGSNGVVQYQSYYHDNSMWYCYSDEVDPIGMSWVAHWMPLPTPPKQ